MSFKGLTEDIDKIIAMQEHFRRYFRVGDDKIFVVSIDLHAIANHRMHVGRKFPKSRDADYFLSQWVMDTNRNSLHFDSLSPRELMHVAEHRALVDNWIRGELAELPPSNCEPPKYPEE